MLPFYGDAPSSWIVRGLRASQGGKFGGTVVRRIPSCGSPVLEDGVALVLGRPLAERGCRVGGARGEAGCSG
ncbi:hypothetical protein ACWDF9_21395 [Streptomyces rubiginosohelvolus]